MSGDTIRLSGTFAGTTSLQNKTATKAITIDATKATFIGTLKFQSVNNIKVVGGRYDSTGGPTAYGRGIVVYKSSNLSFDKLTVVASGTDGETGVGLEGVTNASVTNSTFTNVGVGVGVTGSSYITLTGNKVVGATKDGYDAYNDHNVVIANNSCSGSKPQAGAHPDCVQLASTGGLPVQSDIKVIDNIATGMTQGFTSFLGSATGSLRITMTGNIINGLMSQGVACYGCVDSFITNNFLSSQPGAPHFVNLNVIGGSNNVVSGNTFGSLNTSSVLPTDYASAYFRLTGTTYKPTFADFSSIGATASMERIAATIPEPGEWALLLAGFGLVGLATRRPMARVVAA
ncbi:right-handed parallel beta-helix repeat-containing protein [Polymorphobacter sp. PAMC 29334]|uniref:right-handed parallel beta-helix repeat-containing protein n=1 Tax=Polymorphobacter sp. PAMC 29334 TaxID=2862331 RepID=UPI001C747BD1|nr:right-handed parallel beta-helix repeat-containing protein [Polymorphobacter sp. PAMC 29334]QYE35937.1 right-handed parallel beta-helix repeat-containing protein [Polymorphobacter sp. PAMC 29334]